MKKNGRKNEVKRLISLILASLMLLSTLGAFSAFAEDEQSGSYEDKMTWSYTATTKTLKINCDGELDFPYPIKYEEYYDMGELQKIFIYKEYPWHVGGFYGKVEHVELSGNITAIGDYVFYNFSSLQEITIPETVTRLGAGVFGGCSKITQIVVPEGVTEIGDAAFSNMNALTSVKLPEGLTSLGGYAFSYTRALTDLVLPENLTHVGAKLFGSFSSYALDNGIATAEDGVIYSGKYALECTGREGDITVKDGTVLIADKFTLFSGSNERGVILPESLKYIGSEAFNYCYVTSVTLPDGVETIGEKAFYGAKITSVNIPASLKVIESKTFENSKIESVYIPKGITRLAADAFDGAPIKAYAVDKNNANYCAVDGVLFNKNKTSLIAYPMAKEGKHYTVPSTVSTLYTSFAGKLETVAFPKSVKNCYRRINKVIYYFGTEEEFLKINFPPKTSYDYYDRIVAKYCKAKLSKTKYTYNGKVRTPAVKVYDAAGNRLKEKVDYKITLPKGRKKIGYYTVKVKLIGKYKGSFNLEYRIAPKGTQIKKLTAGVASFKVKWTKQNKNITGYQIQYSTNEGFGIKKNVFVNKPNATAKTVKGLSVDKKYYVRVRTYKKVKGKNVYSSWSKVKKIKVTKPY